MREAIAILRGMNREEDIELIYFGGVRSGTDLAKLIGLGANAAVLSAAMAFALGGGVEAGTIRFDGGRSADEHAEAASLLLKSLTGEASIMARCTGKTNVHNIEPEDLRSISVATAEASGIPVAIG
jgi:isopentenyl diphosphate isomerase/L-lactate dehydrogenase-like FMN-dependent dehydrogenase